MSLLKQLGRLSAKSKAATKKPDISSSKTTSVTDVSKVRTPTPKTSPQSVEPTTPVPTKKDPKSTLTQLKKTGKEKTPEPWLELAPKKGEFVMGDRVVDDEGRHLTVEDALSVQYACSGGNGRIYFYMKTEKQLRRDDEYYS